MEKLGKLDIITPEQRAQDLMVLSTAAEMLTAALQTQFGGEESKKRAAAALPLKQEELLKPLEEMVDAVDKFFCGKGYLTLADLAIYDLVSNKQAQVIKWDAYP